MSIARTHRADLFRPSVETEERGHQEEVWPEDPHASGVGCNLQPRSGELRAAAAGQQADATWNGFFPPGTDLEEGDGVRVTEGVGPERFRCAFVSEQGGRWDVESDLQIAREEF